MFPEGDDPRVQDAATRLERDGLAIVEVLGKGSDSRTPFLARHLRSRRPDRFPTDAAAGVIDGSLAARPVAVESTAGGHHWHAPRSIRFMPEPSPGSIGACAPVSSEARNELTRCTRSVAA